MAWLTGYTQRLAFTLDSNSLGLSGDVSAKQIELVIGPSYTEFWAGVKADGGDVRVTAADGTTLLKKYTVAFDNTGDIAVYKVRIPSVTAATDVPIYVYFGKPDATTDDDLANTLETDILALWPLDLNHVDGAFADIASTNDGTNTGTTDTAGQVGRARAFNGSSQYINCGTGLAVSGSRTVAASLNGVHGAAAMHMVLAKYGTASGSVQDLYLAIYQQKIRTFIGSATAGNSKVTQGGTTLSDSTNYVVGMSWDNSDAANHPKVWLNGLDDSSTYSDIGDPFTVANATAEPVLIGARNASSPISFYQGWIDEVAYYSSVKSADWWKVENASRRGTWAGTGAYETFAYTAAPDGGFVVGGTAPHTIGYNYTPDGGFVLGGEAEVTYAPALTHYPIGGFVLGGEAGYTYGLTHTPDGGLVLGGAAEVVFTSPITDLPFIWRIINPVTKAPVTGDAANTTIKIRRSSDGLYLDWADMTFKGSGWTTLEATMDEMDATNTPGAYIKVASVAQFLDGKYQVFAEYAGAFNDYADGEFMVTGGLVADIQTSTAAISWLSSVREGVDTLQIDTALLLAFIRNKKYLQKTGTTWYLIIRNADDTADILNKALKGTDGVTEITDIAAAAMGMEIKSSV